MKTLQCLIKVVALAAFLAGSSNAMHAADKTVQPAMVGGWAGDAQVIVIWCRQKKLPVKVDVKPDGSVSGSIGDAALVRGRLKGNRGWLGRKLNLKTDYIITGELAGPIVKVDGIRRKRVSMPLNFSGGAFSGGLHTSGSKFGGKESGILSAGLDLGAVK